MEQELSFDPGHTKFTVPDGATPGSVHGVFLPGGYRAAMRFVVDGSGRIANAFLLHTSGDRARDGAILETLRQVRIDRAPPPEMAQPLTMLILPRAQTPGLECPGRHGGPDR